MTTALYDQPGPRAIARNRVFSILSGLAVLALLAWIVYRFYITGQFEAIKWEQFQYKAVQKELLAGYLTTLKIFVDQRGRRTGLRRGLRRRPPQ